jgi:erythromycin esterase
MENELIITTEKSKEEIVRLSTSADLDPLMERIGNARFVLLGEASHGTHEYYTWRTAITKRLIREKNFNFIAVEGDWPDCYHVNRYIKGYSDQHKTAAEVLHNFRRWPTWMWANWEIAALMEWLKNYNSTQFPDKVGFYGLDVYSLWESLEMLDDYLQKHDPSSHEIVQKITNCFETFGNNEQIYAQFASKLSCKEDITTLLKEVLKKSQLYNEDPEASLNMIQNSQVLLEAENYYSSMLAVDKVSWNIRDKHMVDTLNRLMEFHGPESKTIVWEHNTHIGDARYTDMKKSGMFNTGQLIREMYPEHEVVLVGFGSYKGTVIAGKQWSAPMEEMTVPEAIPGSLENYLHVKYGSDQLIIFDREKENPEFGKTIPHRAIGVVYHPNNEYHNYVPSLVNKRYDCFIYIDETKALHPLLMKPDKKEVPSTYPFEF